MAWTHVRHKVADYNRWKEVYDTAAGLKQEYGWKRYRLFMVNGDRTDLLVMEEFGTVEEAQRFLNSDDFRKGLKLSGVVGTPDVLILEGLEEGRA